MLKHYSLYIADFNSQRSFVLFDSALAPREYTRGDRLTAEPR